VTTKIDHYYAPNNDQPNERLICACGHVEAIDGDFSAATGRMNVHIRSAYTDEEWEAKMQQTKLALLDSKTGTMKMPSDGPKS
jgi:hypothetical protein